MLHPTVGSAPASIQRVWRYLYAAALVFASACGHAGPASPTVPIDQQFTLSVGGGAVVEGTVVTIRFVAVSSDSRCPMDVVCIQQGDAVVHLEVQEGSSRDGYELHTRDGSAASVTHGSLRIALVQLQPAPVSTRAIQQSEYRAVLMVTRR